MRRAFFGLLLLGACQEPSIYGIYDYTGAGEAPSLRTPRKTDVVEQRIQPKVDVLWVIDNSGSMNEEQEKVAVNFEAFTQFFVNSGLDWHIGAITTDCGSLETDGATGTGLDPDCGKLIKVAGYPYLTPEVPAAEAMFRQLVRAGAGGSSDEMGLLATWRALVPVTPEVELHNKGFLRKNAALHIIVVSDEADSSPYPTFNMPEFTGYLKYQLKSESDRDEIPVTFSSIVGPRPGGCIAGDGSGNAGAGTEYIEATNEIGGMFASICTADWYPVLEALGLQAAGLRDEYFLSEIPVPGSIELWVDDEGGRRDGIDQASLVEGDVLADVCQARDLRRCFEYAYDAVRNAVRTIDYLPAPNADIHIRYELRSELEPIVEDDTDAVMP